MSGQAELEAQLAAETAALADLQRQYRVDLAAAQQRQGEQMIARVEEVAEQVASERGLTLLLERDGVLYTPDGAPAEPVINPVTVAEARYETGVAKHTQVSRHPRLALFENFLQFADGRLAGRRAWPWAIGGGALLLLLVFAAGYPRSMVGVPGEEVSNTLPPSLAMLALGSLQAGLLQQRTLRDWDEAQQSFDAFRELYNFERPHQALGLAVPASRYRPSTRHFPDKLPAIDYDPIHPVRKVDCNGQIGFGRQRFRISKALAGQPVALCPDPDQDGRFSVLFCHHRVRQIDLRDPDLAD